MFPKYDIVILPKKIFLLKKIIGLFSEVREKFKSAASEGVVDFRLVRQILNQVFLETL